MNTTLADFPAVDVRTQDAITAEQAQFFRDNGLLLIRGLLHGEELELLRRQTQTLVDQAAASRVENQDFKYKTHRITGKEVPFRVEYVIDKLDACKALLGHPFILRSIEQLQGPSFIPTWDSMVFKLPGMGAAIEWHRDTPPQLPDAYANDSTNAINVDFYLDGSDETNCLWGVPGSNRWPHDEARRRAEQLNEGGFSTEGAVPLPVKPGDVLLHSTLVLHGSAPAQSSLRRVVYYEFRPISVELSDGPHTPDYIPLKQQILLDCLRRRQTTSYAKHEKPYAYKPEAGLSGDAASPPKTFRTPHDKHWRTGRPVDA